MASAPGAAGAARGTSATHLPAVTDGTEAADQSTQELLRDAESAFNEIFSVRAPRDVLAGLWSAAQCILSGVFLGLAGVIMQPIEGMRDSGVPGCFRGAALGVCTGLFFSLTGLCTGIFQAVRGVWATPRAVCMATQGRQWDSTAGNWVEPKPYSLTEEAARVLGEHGEEEEEEEVGTAGAPARRRVVDTYYYDQLQLPPTASQQEIRRAYFQKSRQWHPDKTSEPMAKEQFQAISEAYQVLSDPARRQAYDAKGRQGAGEGFVDARVFFSVLLGADALEPHIGRLRIAEMFSGDLFGGGTGDGANSDVSQQLRDIERGQGRQTRRQLRLAVSLAERLDSHAGDITAFQEAARQEAQGILQGDAWLERFVAEIGWVYANRAELHLVREDSCLGSMGARALRLRLRGRGREVRQQATTAGLAVRSVMKLRRIVNEADKQACGDVDAGGAGEDEMPSTLTSALPTFMETFWSLVAHDITGTLDKVVGRVLGDTAAGAEVLRQRAEGLRQLGEAFLVEAEAARVVEAAVAAGSGSGGGSTVDDEKQRKRFEEAFIASMGAGGQAPE